MPRCQALLPQLTVSWVSRLQDRWSVFSAVMDDDPSDLPHGSFDLWRKDTVNSSIGFLIPAHPIQNLRQGL
jgi:hypothetical protein